MRIKYLYLHCVLRFSQSTYFMFCLTGRYVSNAVQSWICICTQQVLHWSQNSGKIEKETGNAGGKEDPCECQEWAGASRLRGQITLKQGYVILCKDIDCTY